MFTVAPLFTPWPFAMARRERRAKRMADWYGLAVEGLYPGLTANRVLPGMSKK